MSIRSLAVALQVSLILFGNQQTLCGQESPSDLVVGELISSRAPWSHQAEPESFTKQDKSLQPNYGGKVCDALPAPQLISRELSTRTSSSLDHFVKSSHPTRVGRSQRRFHTPRASAKPRSTTEAVESLSGLTRRFWPQKGAAETQF